MIDVSLGLCPGGRCSGVSGCFSFNDDTVRGIARSIGMDRR